MYTLLQAVQMVTDTDEEDGVDLQDNSLELEGQDSDFEPLFEEATQPHAFDTQAQEGEGEFDRAEIEVKLNPLEMDTNSEAENSQEEVVRGHSLVPGTRGSGRRGGSSVPSRGRGCGWRGCGSRGCGWRGCGRGRGTTVA